MARDKNGIPSQKLNAQIVARWVSSATHPVLLAIPLVLLVSSRAANSWREGLQWGSLYLLLAILGPAALLMQRMADQSGACTPGRTHQAVSHLAGLPGDHGRTAASLRGPALAATSGPDSVGAGGPDDGDHAGLADQLPWRHQRRSGNHGSAVLRCRRLALGGPPAAGRLGTGRPRPAHRGAGRGRHLSRSCALHCGVDPLSEEADWKDYLNTGRALCAGQRIPTAWASVGRPTEVTG